MAVIAMLIAQLPARAEDWAPNLTLAAAWQSNATHADLRADRISALQTEAGLIAAERYAFGKLDSLQLAARGRAEWWPRFRRLFEAGAGASVEWRHQFGAAPLAAEIFAEAGGELVTAKDSGRRGTGTFGRFGFRKQFDQHWRAALTHELSRHYARAEVFDRSRSETRLEIGRDVTDVARLTLAVRYGDGDIVTYSDATRLALLGPAEASRQDDTFGRLMDARRIDARTFAAKVGIIRALDQYTALILSYEYRDTRRGAFEFTNHVTALAVVNQF